MPALPTRANPMVASYGQLALLTPNLLRELKDIEIPRRSKVHMWTCKLCGVGEGFGKVGKFRRLS
eukprot:12420258-Karenia_brevis.AAC.1